MRRKRSAGTQPDQVLSLQGDLTWLKLYAGAKPLAGFPEALYRRASCNAATAVGKYAVGMEAASPNADQPPCGWDGHDDQ
jgi:hypothetical protein